MALIRPATAPDAPAVAALVARAYAPWVPIIGRPPGPLGDDYAARVAAGQVWVLERASTLLGALVLVAAPGHLLLDNVAVDPARHGEGLGRALVAFAEAEARRRGLPEVRLYTHARMAANIALYARLGYAETGRGEQAGFSRVFMAKAVG